MVLVGKRDVAFMSSHTEAPRDTLLKVVSRAESAQPARSDV
jgi:hypothetical protein